MNGGQGTRQIWMLVIFSSYLEHICADVDVEFLDLSDILGTSPSSFPRRRGRGPAGASLRHPFFFVFGSCH